MLVVLLAIGSVPATIATLVLLSRFDLKGVVAQHVITVTLGAVLLVTALFLITGRSIRTRYADRLNRLDPDTARLFTVALGLTMGVLVTITSVGAGAIGVTVLLLLHPKMPAGRIVGSDIAHGVPLTLLAGAGHWYLGSVDWGLLGNLLIGSLPGIVFGSYLATRAARPRVLRPSVQVCKKLRVQVACAGRGVRGTCTKSACVLRPWCTAESVRAESVQAESVQAACTKPRVQGCVYLAMTIAFRCRQCRHSHTLKIPVRL
jgi:hypothetical protein